MKKFFLIITGFALLNAFPLNASVLSHPEHTESKTAQTTGEHSTYILPFEIFTICVAGIFYLAGLQEVSTWTGVCGVSIAVAKSLVKWIQTLSVI